MAGPERTPAWRALERHAAFFRRPDFRLGELARSDGRFEAFAIEHDGLLLDGSRQLMTAETAELLEALALQRGLPAAVRALFAGEAVNRSENRAALHTALRAPAGPGARPEVARTLERMEALVEEVHGGGVADVVHLGIGGSALGPAMAVRALEDFDLGRVRLHFVSGMDPAALDGTLAGLDPRTTLFVAVSKSFATAETLRNAARARRWSGEGGERFVAVTGDAGAARAFGIDEDRILPLWDWVGGRFSLCSAAGLPVALAVGMDGFRELLAGARGMDRHFLEAPPARSMPAMMGLAAVWYRAFFDARSTVVAPYAQRLDRFPAYLQQLSMESLGKGVDQDGEPVRTGTGGAVWGAAGTDGQHAYFQLLHQGTEFIPVEFIAAAAPDAPERLERHRLLLANCLGQAQALMDGRPGEADPHRRAPGNRPSGILLLERLDPRRLGALAALYEHRVFAQSVIWGVNAFDQWGVELGKTLAAQVHGALSGGEADAAVAGLVRRIREMGG